MNRLRCEHEVRTPQGGDPAWDLLAIYSQTRLPPEKSSIVTPGVSDDEMMSGASVTERVNDEDDDDDDDE
eukprot:6740915-Pyramimonas_sp.AAC.1